MLPQLDEPLGLPKPFSILETPETPEVDESPVDANFSHNQVHRLAKESLDFLAGMALPEVYKYAFPALYIKAWMLITSKLFLRRDFSQIAFGLPRGFAKTLVIKLLILYAILFTKKQFILVICENEDKAISILADVADMLNEPNIQTVFGNWKSGNDDGSMTQRKKKFSFRGRDIILKAAGAQSGIRGITEKNRRPDVMIFDDIQSREDSESPLLSKQLVTWMTGTAMKAKSPEGCLFLFIANMYPTEGSLLRRLKKNPNWVKFIVGGILADGTSLWEELQPLAQLIQEYENDCASGQPEVFHAEVLNDENATVNTALSIDAIPAYPFTDDTPHNGAFIVIDPSSSDGISADEVSIGAFIFIGAELVFREVKEGKLSPGDTIREAVKMALRWGASLVVPEANAYQLTLKYWMEESFKAMHISGITVQPIYSGKASKNARILAMFKGLKPSKVVDALDPFAIETHLHPDVRPFVFTQINSFNPLKRTNTDGILDLLTYAPIVREKYAQYITLAWDERITDATIIDESLLDAAAGSPF